MGRSAAQDYLQQIDRNTEQLYGGLGNVSTNVSHLSLQLAQLHSTVSDVDSRMVFGFANLATTVSDIDSRISTLNATASALAAHAEANRLHLQYLNHVAASGATLSIVVNPAVGDNTLIPGTVNSPIRIHSIHIKGAVFHANPSRRLVFKTTSGEELFACHVGASNAANAGVVDKSWYFPNTPVRVVPLQNFIISPATGWTVQCHVSIHYVKGSLETL